MSLHYKFPLEVELKYYWLTSMKHTSVATNGLRVGAKIAALRTAMRLDVA